MKMNYPNEKFPGFPPEPSMNFWSYPKDLNGYWHTLTGSEQKILDYILRHTWGFNKTKDEISLTQLETGIEGFDKGTGLTRPTIIIAIRGLINKGFIEKTGGKIANCYELVKNFNYPSKNNLPTASKEILQTIENNTIKNKQYNFLNNKEKANAYKRGERWGEKPYFWNQEMRWLIKKKMWKVIPKDGGTWLEFKNEETKIEWK